MKHLKTMSLVWLLLLICMTSCEKDTIEGRGAIITENLSLAAFDKLTTSINSRITIIQGTEQSVVFTGHANIIGHLNPKVTNGTFELKLDNEFHYGDYVLDIKIVTPFLIEIQSYGSDIISLSGFDSQETLNIYSIGSGDIVIEDFKGLKSFSSSIVGSGNIRLNNIASTLQEIHVNITGSGNVNAIATKTDDCYIDVVGSGNCKISVEKILDVTISGSGDVYYLGNPTININNSGSGSLISLN